MTACINASLSSGIVPKALKCAIVTPLLKKDGLDLNCYKNYRPVSNLPYISKIIEKVVARQLVDYMSDHKLHDPLQSAYRSGHSTETALLKVKSDINLALDKGEGVLLLLLDLSAAFDTVDHQILLRRLENDLGVRGVALRCFTSYLAERAQSMTIAGALSAQKELHTGVPQGSVLGPILFLAYLLPLRSIIQRYSVLRQGYADDTQLYKSFLLSDLDTLKGCISTLEVCVADVRSWMSSNKLKFNDAKTELLVIASKYHLPKIKSLDITVKVGSACIKPSDTVRDLGATFDSHMDMIPHVNKVSKGLYFNIHRISRIRRHLVQDVCAKVINALFTSRLDFQNSLLVNLPESTLMPLQRAQNCAARLLTGTRKHDHISPVLRNLHWLPVRKRIVYKVLVLAYKVLHNLPAPVYMSEWLTEYCPVRSLRSASQPLQLNVPRTSKTVGTQAYASAAPYRTTILSQDISQLRLYQSSTQNTFI
jgi:hypothetical protein